MSDIVRLLPDSVANQIAAGEVIQRPASAVKELLENAVDAKATRIRLIVYDAGKTQIRVIDNGSGMSENDARMCFERHATSKLSCAEDLFAIRTNGFRGEAMASIAAVAHVEMRSRQDGHDLGIRINIEGSVISRQEACQTPMGTDVSIKNLFYNVPARRNFLKSNQVETRHIMDEFTRIALACTGIEMSLHNNEDELYHLRSANLRQRIVDLFGKGFNEKLVPMAEETSIAKVNGFIGKPQFARKRRGEQFFFCNGRFIRSAYLNHAVTSAYTDMITEKTYPAYFIFIEVDPATIDVNIHPTKTEIKFEDEKALYAILRSAVRQSLGKYNISPTIDFNQEMSLSFSPPPKNVVLFQPELPVRHSDSSEAHSDGMRRSRPELANGHEEKDWQQLYQGLESGAALNIETRKSQTELAMDDSPKQHPLQIHGKYILASIRSGTIIIHQKRAHQRVIYEKIVRNLALNRSVTQQQLFPINLSFSSADARSIKGMLDELRLMGVHLEPFGKNSFIVQGLAPYIGQEHVQEMIDELLDEHRSSGDLSPSGRQEKLAKIMSRKAAVDNGKALSSEEMIQLIDELFACDLPYSSPNGKPTMITFSLDELDKRFGP